MRLILNHDSLIPIKWMCKGQESHHIQADTYSFIKMFCVCSMLELYILYVHDVECSTVACLLNNYLAIKFKHVPFMPAILFVRQLF